MKIEKVTLNKQLVSAKLFFAIVFTVIFLLAGQSNCFAATVALQWAPNTETDLAGYRIYYQADSSVQPFTGAGATQGSSPVDVHNLTTATIGGLDPAHAYSFAITAYNTSGAESAYSNTVYVPELVSPIIALSSPTNNATVSGTVSVTANASDNVGVTKVEYYVNGILQATDTSTPYLFSWNTSALAAGTYTLMAKAYDVAGNVGQSSNVTVSIVKDTTAPAVSLTAPGNNATVSGTVTITVTASDNVGVSNVEFYENGVMLFASNVAPYSFNWHTTSVANGSCTLTAKAYDNAGNIGQSPNVFVTVNNLILDPPPPVASDKVGVFTNGTWYVDLNGNGVWDGTPTDGMYTFGSGITGAIPVTGDWNSDGKTEIGVFVDGIWYLDMNGNGRWDGERIDIRGVFGTGLHNAKPVVGDWNGDGKTKIGIYADGIWYLDTNQNWVWDGERIDIRGMFGTGLPNAKPVTGDWNSDGITEIGVYSEGNWYLDKNRSWAWDGVPTDTYGVFGAGLPNVVPVTGDWNGDGPTRIGVFSDGNWYLDKNNSWDWNGKSTDTYGAFGKGLPNVVPVVGNW